MTKIEPEMLKMCKESLNELIEDSEKYVTLSLLSNNYGLDFESGQNIMKMWLKENSDKAKKIKKNFFVQYKDEAGNVHLSIVDEEKLKNLKKNFTELTEMLYGISLVTANRSLGITERFENVHIPIRVDSEERKFHYQPKLNPVPETKHKEKPTAVGTKSINTLFAQPPSSSIKNTSSSEVNKEKELVKTEKQTPKKKESPVKKSSNTSKPAPKGNIASFFAKGATKPVKPPVTTPTPTTSSVKSKPDSVDTKKRPASPPLKPESNSDDVILETPVANVKKITRPAKKFKPAKKPDAKSGKKLSRVMQLDDSSEDDQEEVEKNTEIDDEKKEIKYEVEDDDIKMVEEVKSKVSPEMKPSTSASTENSKGKRRKGKRLVDRTYMDDEGFVVTQKEYEDYSLSEEEAESPKKVKTKNPKPTAKSAPVNTKTKQGNILSFFKKK